MPRLFPRLRFGVGAVGLATLLIAAPSGAGRSAAAVECGDRLTNSVVLTKNLHCSGDGLVIGASNVTIALHGHTISGANGGTGIQLVDGSEVEPWFDGLKVLGPGRIEGFGIGVRIDPMPGGSRGHVIRGITIAANSAGVLLSNVRDMTVSNNRIQRNGWYGINAFSADATVEDNDISFNGMFGIVAQEDGPRIIRRNRVVGNGATGIRVWDMATTVSDNIASGNGGDGIEASERLDQKETLVFARNTANFNGGFGIRLREPGMTDGGGNKAKGNGEAAQCLNIVCETPPGHLSKLSSIRSALHTLSSTLPIQARSRAQRTLQALDGVLDDSCWTAQGTLAPTSDGTRCLRELRTVVLDLLYGDLSLRAASDAERRAIVDVMQQIVEERLDQVSLQTDVPASSWRSKGPTAHLWAARRDLQDAARGNRYAAMLDYIRAFDRLR